MASAFFIFLTITTVSAHGYAVDSASPHRQCVTDHQCDEGFFCYDESHYCTRCVECSSYKRKSSWRTCPKIPSDCGACLSGHEEDILHEGKTRDMCIPTFPNTLSHTNVPDYSSLERYMWAAAVTALFLPIVFYAFCRKNRIRDHGTIHRGLHREEPPPYRSIELTTLSSNNSEERLSEDDHVLSVGQQKDHLVQAVPFQKPAYMETELLAFDNTQDNNSEEIQYLADNGVMSTVSSVDLHDENTMPSDWTPMENIRNGQLMSFEPTDSSESEETCEPATKRHKTSETQDDEESNNTHNLNINLFINNNVTIHKPS